MTLPLFSLLAAAAVASAGIGANGDTRSAQSLPSDNLAVASASAVATGKTAVRHGANHLADANDGGMAEGKCVRDKKLVDADHPLCAKTKGGGFAGGTPLAFGLGAAAVAGVVIAATSGHHHSENSMSN